MSTNIVNEAPFLRTSRNFPLEAQPLAVETNKSYVDIASAVNSRTIGLFTTSGSTVNGESWFVTNNSKQQGFRRIYVITGAGDYPHGLNFRSISMFVRIFGTFFDGTSYGPLPYVDENSVSNQISILVDPVNILIRSGSTAPVVFKGIVDLEWISLT